MWRSLLPSRVSPTDFSLKPAARKCSRSNEKSPARSGRKGPVPIDKLGRTDSRITRPSVPGSCPDVLFEIHHRCCKARRSRSPELQVSLVKSKTLELLARHSLRPASFRQAARPAKAECLCRIEIPGIESKT